MDKWENLGITSIEEELTGSENFDQFAGLSMLLSRIFYPRPPRLYFDMPFPHIPLLHIEQCQCPLLGNFVIGVKGKSASDVHLRASVYSSFEGSPPKTCFRLSSWTE